MMRRSTDDELRKAIWDRDAGQCQDCGIALKANLDPAEPIIEAILILDDLPIYKWTKDCWKCKQPTGAVTYLLEAWNRYTLGDIEKLDFTLMARYPFIRKQFSRVLECEVVANVCVHCNTHQSNFYVSDEITKILSSQADVEALVDDRIPNILQVEDFPDCKTASPKASHVHHKDGDWQNNDLGNLALLCRACHLKAHSR